MDYKPLNKSTTLPVFNSPRRAETNNQAPPGNSDGTVTYADLDLVPTSQFRPDPMKSFKSKQQPQTAQGSGVTYADIAFVSPPAEFAGDESDVTGAYAEVGDTETGTQEGSYADMRQIKPTPPANKPAVPANKPTVPPNKPVTSQEVDKPLNTQVDTPIQDLYAQPMKKKKTEPKVEHVTAPGNSTELYAVPMKN